MPIYEYQCQKCDHQFETIQKVADAPLEKCPECGKRALKKLVSRAAFRLKGGGWYETDFKSGGKKNVAGEEKSSSKDKTDGGDAAKTATASASEKTKAEPAKSKGSASAD